MSSTPFHAHRHLLRPGSREAVRRWQAEMDRRDIEVRETLRAEGVELELVLFEPAAREGDADSLIFILRTHDYARAVDVFLRSTLAVDLVHRAFMAEVSLGSRPLEVVGCHASEPDGNAG